MRLTIPQLHELARKEKLAMLTSYDASFARLSDEAGVDILLIGDSLGMVVQGHDSTLPVTMEQTEYHVSMVARGSSRALVLADLPFGAFQESKEVAFRNAARLMAAGAGMVKIEGGAVMVETTRFLVERGVPVCSHIGLLPQSVHTLGGYRVQGKTEDGAERLVADARALEAAGASIVLMEAMPAAVARRVTDALTVPTIGIGAGPDVSGQVLVVYDMLHIYPGRKARFVKNFMEGAPSVKAGIEAYVKAVKAKTFPVPSIRSEVDLIHAIAPLRERLRAERSIAFVPTMGNLHAGHLALVDIAKKRGKCVVASIFVNRLQFGPGGDFDRYPRTLDNDCLQLEKAGCDVAFAPDEREMYPVPQEVTINPPAVAATLEGAHRPGHFEGVATVVAKLFNVVAPQVAVFGKKDYQQLLVVRALVRQLGFGIEVVGAETMREPDGLAMSSRNGYLGKEERAEAVRLNRTLIQVRERIGAGERDFGKLESAAAAELQEHGWKVDYVAIRGRDTLAAPLDGEDLVALAAARLGRTRLIDNLEI